jgi:hypothetical protein
VPGGGRKGGSGLSGGLGVGYARRGVDGAGEGCWRKIGFGSEGRVRFLCARKWSWKYLIQLLLS